MPQNISFDSYNLQDSRFFTEAIDHETIPSIEVVEEKLAHDHGTKSLRRFFRKRLVTVKGRMVCTTASGLDGLIDEMKKNLKGREKNLDIDYMGGTRRYTATMSRLDIKREPWEITTAPYRIAFACSYPFGKDTTTVSGSETGITTSEKTINTTILGSMDARPTIVLDVVAATTFSGITIGVGSDEIKVVQEPYQIGDALEIDFDALTVKVNGIETDYIGSFPAFEPGDISIVLTFSGVSQNVAFTMVYYPEYL